MVQEKKKNSHAISISAFHVSQESEHLTSSCNVCQQRIIIFQRRAGSAHVGTKYCIICAGLTLLSFIRQVIVTFSATAC